MLLQRFLHNGNTAPTLSQTTDYRQRRVLYSLYLSIPFYTFRRQRTIDNRLRSSILSIPSILFYTLYPFRRQRSSILFYTLYTFRGQRTRGGVQYFLNIVVMIRTSTPYRVKLCSETVSLYLLLTDM